MDKKLELLAKTLMDASKILFIISIGYAGWIIHPIVREKGEN